MFCELGLAAVVAMVALLASGALWASQPGDPAGEGPSRSCPPAQTAPAGQPVERFPGQSWDVAKPAEVGVDPAKLQAFIDSLCTPAPKRSEGPLAEVADYAGCVIKDGRLIATWGEPARKFNWFSSSKPMLSTLLFFAIQEGRLKSVDDLVADQGWALVEKDKGMTFRHLADMTSGYTLPEPAGTAWGYNDFAIHLYALSLDRVFGGHGLNEPANRLLAPLGLQDGDIFGDAHRGYGVVTSPRDFARVGWLWMHRGNWAGKQVLQRKFLDQYMKPDVPWGFPVSAGKDAGDYLNIGSYGGGNNQTAHGPGQYGFNWWFNAVSPRTGQLFYCHLPADAFFTLGFNGNYMLMIPSRGLIVAARGYWGNPHDDAPRSVINRNLKTLMEALGA